MEKNPDIFLVIDRGNTATKLSVMRDYELVHSEIHTQPDLRVIANLIEQYHPVMAVYASTGHDNRRVLDGFEARTGIPLLYFDHSTPIPVGIDYDTPHTLGLDRIAAAAALKALGYTSALVADAGTALTIDRFEDGFFRGGNICAGIPMRLRALNRFTDRLPKLFPAPPDALFGHDTTSAMIAGATIGAAAEVKYLYEHSGLSRQPSLVVTGGNGELLAGTLRSMGLEPTVITSLNAIGLVAIARHVMSHRKAEDSTNARSYKI